MSTSTVHNETDEIRRQMAKIRSELHSEMRGVVDVATAATDWRAYIRNRPWLAIGLAFTAGFVVVPRRSKPTTIVVQQPAADVENLVAAPESANRFSVMRWVMGTVGTMAVRAAQSYASNYVENFLANHPPVSSPAATSRPASPNPTSRPEGRDFLKRG